MVLLGGFTALLVGRSIASAEAARARWGTTVAVVVISSAVAAGADLEPHAVVERWPLAMAPPEALSSLEPGARAAVDLDAGVPLTPAAVSGPGADDNDRVSVAVPLGPASMDFQQGDRVDLWRTVDQDFAAPSARRTTDLVAAAARVVTDSDPRRVVVEVTAEEAGAVVDALATATVTPTLVG